MWEKKSPIKFIVDKFLNHKQKEASDTMKRDVVSSFEKRQRVKMIMKMLKPLQKFSDFFCSYFLLFGHVDNLKMVAKFC